MSTSSRSTFFYYAILVLLSIIFEACSTSNICCSDNLDNSVNGKSCYCNEDHLSENEDVKKPTWLTTTTTVLQNSTSKTAFTLIGSCSKKWLGSESIRQKCELPLQTYPSILNIPVAAGQINYFNYFCALCNGVDQHLVQWGVMPLCKNTPSLISMEDVDFQMEFAKLDPKSNDYRFKVQDQNTLITSECVFLFEPPIAMKENSFEDQLCSYMSGDSPETMCAQFNRSYSGWYQFGTPNIFTAIAQDEISSIQCEKHELKDPFNRKCFHFSSSTQDGESSFDPISEYLANCKTMELEPDMYALVDDAVFVYFYETLYNDSSYRFHYVKDDEISLRLCPYNYEARANSNYFFFLLVCMWMTIVIVLLTLLFLFLYPKNKTNFNFYIMSYTFSVFCGELAFLIGFIYWPRQACAYSGISTYYFVIASFLWAIIAVSDVLRRLKKSPTCKSILDPTEKFSFRKFNFKSLFCWGTAFVGVALLLLFKEARFLQPKFGKPLCWMNDDATLSYFYMLPFVSTLILFLVILGEIFYNYRGNFEKGWNKDFEKQLRLCCKLYVFLYGYWFLGFPSLFFNNHIVKYMFIACVKLQSIVIFLEFNQSEQVVESTKDKSVFYRFHYWT